MGGPAVRRDVMPPLRGRICFWGGSQDCACPGLFSFGPSGASLPEFVTTPRRRFARQLIWALSMEAAWSLSYPILVAKAAPRMGHPARGDERALSHSRGKELRRMGAPSLQKQWQIPQLSRTLLRATFARDDRREGRLLIN